MQDGLILCMYKQNTAFEIENKIYNLKPYIVAMFLYNFKLNI